MNQEPKLGWSWGAFMYNIAWGIGNKAYLTLLCLVPILSIVWIFVCGACGKKWAWNSGMYATAEEFNAAMKSWDRAGLFTFIIAVIVIALYILLVGAVTSAIVASGNF